MLNVIFICVTEGRSFSWSYSFGKLLIFAICRKEKDGNWYIQL